MLRGRVPAIIDDIEFSKIFLWHWARGRRVVS